jgi:hypothetical protein
MMCVMIPPKEWGAMGGTAWRNAGFDCESCGDYERVTRRIHSENNNPYEHPPASFGNEEDLDGTRRRGDAGNNVDGRHLDKSYHHPQIPGH